jgi:methionyl-tRNA formyltransferase
MRIFIVTMDDPVYTIPFIKEIISKRKKDIIGIASAKGDRLKINKKRSKIVYVISLFMIMGCYHFMKNSALTIGFKIRKKISVVFPIIKSPSITSVAKENGIPSFEITSPNNSQFIMTLKSLEPDIIINQSQYILKSELLSIPKIGTLNRHNALLPKNRGRLTPFWVLFKHEKETGVSIHFVDEGMDSGPIVVQKRYTVNKVDSFNSIVSKNYKLAGSAMLEAIDLLENGFKDFIPNKKEHANYNTVPTLIEAIKFRRDRMLKYFNT